MPAAVALAARSALSSKYSASASGEAPPRLIRSHLCSLPPACGSRGTAKALKRIVESTQIKRKMSTASPARGWITCTSTCTVATHQSLPACCKDSPLSPLSHTRTKFKVACANVGICFERKPQYFSNFKKYGRDTNIKRDAYTVSKAARRSSAKSAARL